VTPNASVAVRWSHSVGGFGCVPAQITADGVDVIAAPGERVAVPPGRCTIRVDVPGFAPHTVAVTIAEGDDRWIQLEEGRLRRRFETKDSEELPHGLSIDAQPWTPPVFPPPRSYGLVAQAEHDEVRLATEEGNIASSAIKVVARDTPRRLLVVPPMLAGDDYQLVWHSSGELVRRPRIEPADDGGRLLMEYLLNGQHAQAAAAARTLERIRGEHNPLCWVSPSCTQLLIGYAHAIGRDCARLTAWCERTAATTELGSDGLVLDAESAWLQGDSELTRRLLARAASLPAPAITLGGELALDRATSLALLTQAASTDEPPDRNEDGDDQRRLRRDPELDHAVRAMSNSWTRTLARADDRSISLSTAETDRMSPDLKQAPCLDRVGWFLRYLWWRIRYTYLRGRPIPFTFAKELLVPDSSSERHYLVKWHYLVGVVLALVLIVAVVQVVVLSHMIEWIGPIGWFAEGALFMLIFLAIGAYAGATVFRDQVIVAQQRADRAEAQAREFHEAAMKGRALGAVLRADANSAEDMPDAMKNIYFRHAAVAKQLGIFDPSRLTMLDVP
jgi:hypothetical protein